MSEFRHELKHELGTAELLALRQRLRAVLDPDKHSPDGRYSVRSLYFDDARILPCAKSRTALLKAEIPGSTL